MVGFVQSCEGGWLCQGFILSGGAFTLLPDAPGSLPGGTFPMAINVSGQVAGWFVDTCICEAHAFVFSGGSYTRVDRPGYVNTSSRGINDLGQLPGSSFQCFGCSLADGFILSQGVFTAFEVPVANSGTEVTGINNAGDFAGYYFVEPNYHAFVVNAGTLTLIEHPDATQGTAIWGQAINAARQLVGSYVAADGLQHGFLASVSVIYSATVQQPINPDGSSVFNAKRGVVPVKFTLAVNGTPTCQLPPATLSLTRTAGGALGVVNESDFTQPSDNGSNFRVTLAVANMFTTLVQVRSEVAPTG